MERLRTWWSRLSGEAERLRRDAEQRAERERERRGSRVDVARITGARHIYSLAGPSWITEGGTEVTCRLERSGALVRLAHRDYDAPSWEWAVGRLLAVRWVVGPHDFSWEGTRPGRWEGDGWILGDPGPAEVPGRRGTVPDAGQRVCTAGLHGQRPGRMQVRDPRSRIHDLRLVDYRVREEQLHSCRQALVRYDWERDEILEVVPFRLPRD